MIVAFIDEQRTLGRGVESICAVLTEHGVTVAPRSYRAWKHATPSDRDRADAVIVDALLSTVGTPEGMYGRRKMTAWLRRHGHAVSKRRVDRLMRQEALAGRVHRRWVRTTTPDRHADRAPDLLDRKFGAPAPYLRWVADFTYFRTWAGFVYVAFVIDCYSRAIVGWHAATTKQTPLFTTALRMGLWRRDRVGHPVGDQLVHHSAAGSQYTSIRFAETLALEGVATSIGSIIRDMGRIGHRFAVDRIPQYQPDATQIQALRIDVEPRTRLELLRNLAHHRRRVSIRI